MKAKPLFLDYQPLFLHKLLGKDPNSPVTKYLKALLGVFIACVVWSAINPLSNGNWYLEMLPVFIALPVLFYLGNRFQISNLSFTLIFFYLLMLVVQAHYGVGYVPIGAKLAPWFGTERNVFDRITHFFSGLLWFYPIYEMTRQSIGKRDFLVYMIPASLIMGLGAVYEVAEWLAFEFLNYRLSYLFIGAQDDFYDPDKDMAVALFGVIIALAVVIISNNFFPRKASSVP
jgi:putative membrane protein